MLRNNLYAKSWAERNIDVHAYQNKRAREVRLAMKLADFARAAVVVILGVSIGISVWFVITQFHG